MPISKVWVSL